MESTPRLLLVLGPMLAVAGGMSDGEREFDRAQPSPGRQAPSLVRSSRNFVAEYNRERRAESAVLRRSRRSQPPWGLRGMLRQGRWMADSPSFVRVTSSSNSRTSRSTVADIGSNDERFWFWMQSKKDKSVYVCNYADLARPTWQ